MANRCCFTHRTRSSRSTFTGIQHFQLHKARCEHRYHQKRHCTASQVFKILLYYFQEIQAIYAPVSENELPSSSGDKTVVNLESRQLARACTYIMVYNKLNELWLTPRCRTGVTIARRTASRRGEAVVCPQSRLCGRTLQRYQRLTTQIYMETLHTKAHY